MSVRVKIGDSRLTGLFYIVPRYNRDWVQVDPLVDITLQWVTTQIHPFQSYLQKNLDDDASQRQITFPVFVRRQWSAV